MEKSFSRIINYHVSVKEVNGKVVFLRKLARGGSEHSFGIHVARLAGMPKSIVSRAEHMLAQLEREHNPADEAAAISNVASSQQDGVQLSFFQLDDPVLSQVRDQILGLDINNLTPMEALNKLHDIRTIITGKSS
jgi:DNA mismatch repair protein MutS